MNTEQRTSEPTTTKAVGWSYPSSPNAKRFGFASAGCYVVETIRGNEPPEALSGHATEDEALAAATALPHEWNPLYLRWHQNLAASI